MAVAAMGFEREVAKHRNIVIESDRVAALRAMGSGENGRLFLGKAVNQDIGEAANDKTQDEDKKVGEPF